MTLPCEHAVETSNPAVVGCGLKLYGGAPHVFVCAKHCGHCDKNYVPPGFDAPAWMMQSEPCCDPPTQEAL